MARSATCLCGCRATATSRTLACHTAGQIGRFGRHPRPVRCAASTAPATATTSTARPPQIGKPGSPATEEKPMKTVLNLALLCLILALIWGVCGALASTVGELPAAPPAFCRWARSRAVMPRRPKRSSFPPRLPPHLSSAPSSTPAWTPPPPPTSPGHVSFAGNDGSFARYPLWVPRYAKVQDPGAPKGWRDGAVWQYSETGEVPGIAGACDHRATRSDLPAWLASGASDAHLGDHHPRRQAQSKEWCICRSDRSTFTLHHWTDSAGGGSSVTMGSCASLRGPLKHTRHAAARAARPRPYPAARLTPAPLAEESRGQGPALSAALMMVHCAPYRVAAERRGCARIGQTASRKVPFREVLWYRHRSS